MIIVFMIIIINDVLDLEVGAVVEEAAGGDELELGLHLLGDTDINSIINIISSNSIKFNIIL